MPQNPDVLPLQNRLLASLPAEAYASLAPHLTTVDLARKKVLSYPGEPMGYA